MTGGEFERAALANHTVVALIPATEDYRWAASQAWAVARAAAQEKPRVALVDLSVNMPVLDEGAARWSEEGIVDALLYDTSLTRLAQPQEEPGLHYIGVGTPTDNPQEVWGHPRWSRLAAGFESQGALLLLFLPPAAIPHAALRPDGIIVLDRGEWNPAASQYLGVSTWLDEGIPLIAVVSQPRDTTGAAAGGVAPTTPGAGGEPKRWDRRARLLAGALAIVILVAVAWAVWRLTQTPAEVASEAAPLPVADSAPTMEAEEPPVEPGSLDTLYYSVQVAAFNTLDRALEYATSLEDRRLVAAVTPVRLRGGTWYRVILGAMQTAAAAEEALAVLWRDGLVASGEGAILRTPQAFDLGIRESADAAWDETQRLRERGIPAYSIGASQGRARIFVGAFETPDQTAVVESLLTAAGLTATLMTRTGNAP
jgi:hypothetical protein